MTKSAKSSSGGSLIVAVLAGTAAWLAFRRPAKAAPSRTPMPIPPARPPSPFVQGSGCTALVEGPAMQRWIHEVVEPLALSMLDAYDVPLDEHDNARATITMLVDELIRKAAPQCAQANTPAVRKLWKGLWCDVVAQLVIRGKLDEELEDVIKLCLDPTFDPRVPRDSTASPIPRSGKPRRLVSVPRPRHAVEPTQSTSGPPTNVRTATTRHELSRLGLMRMMEGTVAGAPIRGSTTLTVVLAYNPAWSRARQLRVELRRVARKHPALRFVEVSFVDSQRHFGKPKDLNGLIWVLTAASPEGRVLPNPIVRDDPRDALPSAEDWAAVIGHASGGVGAPRVRRINRPRRMGDLLLAMLPAKRTSRRPPPVPHARWSRRRPHG